MAEQLYFSRDTKCYIEIGSDIWEIPILDGYAFSQTTNTSEIVLAEMESTAGVSRRGKRVFNDSLAPVEWSISTYVRPFLSNGDASSPPLGAVDTVANVHAVEEVLWALHGGPAAYASSTFTNQFTADGTDVDIDWSESNKSTIGEFNIYFTTGDANKKTYKIRLAVVNEATIDFDIDGIASINWSGFGADIALDTEPVATLYEAINETTNFIRNRLTTLSVTPDSVDPDGDSTSELQATYDLTLTGGSITLSNNITYITPEELGFVNIPLGHVTGTRSVSGSFTNYVVFNTAAVDKSIDLWEDLAAATNVVTHNFSLVFQIGGTTGGTPRLYLTIPNAAIDIPAHSVEDVISLETTFSGLPTSIDLTDEITLQYFGIDY